MSHCSHLTWFLNLNYIVSAIFNSADISSSFQFKCSSTLMPRCMMLKAFSYIFSLHLPPLNFFLLDLKIVVSLFLVFDFFIFHILVFCYDSFSCLPLLEQKDLKGTRLYYFFFVICIVHLLKLCVRFTYIKIN